MAKTNYGKVEEILTKGIDKIKILRIHALADQSVKDGKPGDLTNEQKLLVIVSHLNWMKKKDPDTFKSLIFNKKDLEELFELKKYEEKHIKTLNEILTQVVKFKNEKFPVPDLDAQVEQEILRHKNKRHNVNEKWLPLDVPRK
jgi:hypothetical protein